jgi:hypothetical protein
MRLENEVAVRLWALKALCEIKSNPELASICATSASAVNNWLRGYNLPRIPEMIMLSEKTSVTLDWIYRGAAASMDPAFSLRLAAYIKSHPSIPSQRNATISRARLSANRRGVSPARPATWI